MKRMAVGSIAAFLIVGVAAVAADERFVPQGHSYAPGHERLPPLNSPPDRLNARADEFQSEIDRRQREEMRQRAELRRFLDHDLHAPSSPLNGYRY